MIFSVQNPMISGIEGEDEQGRNATAAVERDRVRPQAASMAVWSVMPKVMGASRPIFGLTTDVR